MSPVKNSKESTHKKSIDSSGLTSMLSVSTQQQNNTKPINIVSQQPQQQQYSLKAHRGSITKTKFNKLSASLTNQDTHTTTNTATIGKLADNMPQSTPSSLISSYSSSNLSHPRQPNVAISTCNKENSFQSPCSSVPTYYGSYGGIYKRLMRSVSNSLINSTNTTVPLQNSLNESNSGSAELVNDCSGSLGVDMQHVKQRKVSDVSSSAFSIREHNKDNLAQPCDKCVNYQQLYNVLSLLNILIDILDW